jgi:dienelactone hydrolase
MVTRRNQKFTVNVLKYIAMLLMSISLLNAVQAQDTGFFKHPYTHDYEIAMANRMKEGINIFLTDYTKKVVKERDKLWNRNLSSPAAYRASVATNRNHLRQIIGAIDQRSVPKMTILGKPGEAGKIAETNKCAIYRVEWDVMGGLKSEGLLLIPKGKITASVVVVPDADESPESYSGLEKGSGLALRLAEGGAQVLIPVLVDRDTRYSGSDALVPSNLWRRSTDRDSASVWTNETHREWIHRQGYIMGRHIIGMEVQKILAAVDWLKQEHPNVKTGVMGYGEGGLLAFYSAALDTRIDVAWVSGYFGPREELWKEPVYRNIWGLLAEFGDAEIASLIALRHLVIEPCPVPEVKEPITPKKGQQDFGFPGSLETPSTTEVKREFDRLLKFFTKSGNITPKFFLAPFSVHYGSAPAFSAFTEYLKLSSVPAKKDLLKDLSKDFVSQERQHWVFDNMVQYIQHMIPTSDRTRYAFLKGNISSPEAWDKDMEPYRQWYYKELVGKINQPLLPINTKMRKVYDEPGWKGYEVVLDVWSNVFAWGILAVPNDIKPGERRPVVVLQHGIGGLPSTSIDGKSYNRVLPALVNRGFIVFSPHNPYQFSVRKANAIKTSVFSVIIPQHQQILNFLKSLNYVDSNHISLYGKSWGGRTALMVPIILKGYNSSICSAYFNNWVDKAVSTHFRNSYFFEGSLGIYVWNMGNTLGHAELASLIAPRPFMVEAGYLDGVAAPEKVAYEFAKVKRLYDDMGIGDRVNLEFFMGGHEINGVGTFNFLHKYLNWSAPVSPTKAQLVTPH